MQVGALPLDSFGAPHIITVAILVAGIAGLCWIGRSLDGMARRRYEMALAVAVGALWISYQAYDFSRHGFDPRYTLPLQMCDFSALIAALVMVRPRRGLQSLAYFWGLALGTQAVITPDLAGGPSSVSFWAFWIYHLFVVGAGVYVVVVQRFRPEWKDLRFALSMGVLYAAAMFTIDAIFDLNYGYFGRTVPSRPTLLDVLGPWPLRCVFMVMLGAAAMTALWLPWLFVKRKAQRATCKDA
ncbi:MAG TPA: TIGR02206 family membrane protein [Gemmatimonadaceae bacterium]